jgi:pimeloyl-ACP methyl ester carboxylesterase
VIKSSHGVLMLKKILKILLISLAVGLLLVLIVPFLIPIPPLEDTRPPQELAYPDSRFIPVRGLDVHYLEAGQGEPVFILLHGFASSTFSWREVIDPLAEQGRVIAYDRPAFGLTERPIQWAGINPYSPDFQPELLVSLMDVLEVERAVLVGNSAGGAVSVQTALQYPERVEGLVLVDPAIYTSGGPGWIRALSGTPQMQRLGPLFVRAIQNWGEDFGRMAWHDPSRITPEVWEGYSRPLQAENWDRALWEHTRASRPPGLEERLAELQLPILVISGDDDRIVPTDESIRLAGELPTASLAVLENCGHVPQEECPGLFMKAVGQWLARPY